MITWIVNRLREPSSWAGLGALAVTAGVGQEQWTAIAQTGAGICALLAILLRERGAQGGAA
jgi:hypothetical protein